MNGPGDVLTAIGPGSTLYPNTFSNGYTIVDREGEVCETAFIHDSLYADIFSDEHRKMLTEMANLYDVAGPLPNSEIKDRLLKIANEERPERHLWQTVQPGTVAVFHKSRSAEFRNQIGSQRAAPVIVYAQGLAAQTDNKNYSFAGITRTNSIRPYDDGLGITVDEMFTIALRGKVTMLNNGPDVILNGDYVEWTFDDVSTTSDAMNVKRQKLGEKLGPRLIVIQRQESTAERVFGRALNFAKRGERLDILLK